MAKPKRARERADQRGGPSLPARSPAVVFSTDSSLSLKWIEGTANDAFELPSGELAGRDLREVVPPCVTGHAIARAAETAVAGEPVSFASEIHGRTFETHISPLRDTNGTVTGCFGVILEAVPDRFFSISVDPLAVMDFEGRFRRTNAAFSAVLGYSEEELRSYPLFRLVHSEDRRAAIAAMRKVLAGEPIRLLDVRCRCKDGSYKWLAWMAAPFVSERIVCAVARDITDRRQREAEVERKRALLALLQRTAVAANEAQTVEEAVRTCLDEVCAHTGWPVGHALSLENGRMRSMELWHLERPEQTRIFKSLSESIDFPPGVDLPGRVLRSGRAEWVAEPGNDPSFPRWNAARQIGIRSGFAFPVLVRAEVAGALEFFSHDSVMEDRSLLDAVTSIGVQLGRVVERARAGRSLREREERYRLVTETALDGIVTIDEAGSVLFANPAAARIFGYGSGAEMTGRWLTDYLPQYDPRQCEAETPSDGPTRSRLLETNGMDAEGNAIWAEISCARAPGPGQPAYTAVIRDITERKKLELQVLHAARLKSVDEIARKVAHDFNHVLTAIMGRASLAKLSLPAAHPVRPMLDDMLAMSERAASLTRQLQEFSNPLTPSIQPIELSQLVQGLASLLRAVMPSHVQLQLHLAEGLPTAEADRTQLEQLVMNLAVNGAEAIRAGQEGAVSVATGAQHVDETYMRQTISSAGMEPGEFAFLEVSDNGEGMDEETILRIFDPLFSTKATGRGAGLSTALATVRGHRGAIEVHSEPGKGSTFRILLPLAVDWTGAGTILVVDDDAAVRSVARAVLERFHYDVLEAANGPEALEIFRRNPAAVSLVLLDMTMLSMSGAEVLQQMRLARPDVKVVLSSGYNEAEALRRFADKGLTAFLKKPYTAEGLAQSMKRALG